MRCPFSLRLFALSTVGLSCVALLGACGEPATIAHSDAYQLVFADEFDAAGAPSATHWNIETGYGPNDDGWGNNEWQLYTASADNVRVDGGNLVLSARCPVAPCGVRDGSVTSGKINSRDKFSFRFGKVEARIKPPVGKAAWPAFWALGANHPEVGWPRSGEIGLMEIHNFYSDEKTVHFMLHWCDETLQAPAPCAYPQGWVYEDQSSSFPLSLGDDFHVFSAEWDESRVVGKIDGMTYFTRAIDRPAMDEFLKEFYLILNVAMGGKVGSGDQAPDDSETFPQTMLVDYIRVYQTLDNSGD
ncbi:MAG: glycoside hydrolase family 16 protein [Gammaproteobacteria bacterium]|nr:glycoside hydrolase family 16 protein [Gammaproteobacteria bacterium]